LQDRLVEGLALTLMESTKQCLAKPNDYKARSEMMWAATLALNGVAQMGLGRIYWPNHLIEHSLSAIFDIAHGAGLAIVIPGWLAYRAKTSPQKIAQFSRRVLGVKASADETAAERGIKRLKSWFKRIGAPVTLQQAKIPESAIESIAANAAKVTLRAGMNDYPKKTIAEILRLCV
jgi:alcohol dehydrogenase YqhD (iron-dependent ADH family)